MINFRCGAESHSAEEPCSDLPGATTKDNIMSESHLRRRFLVGAATTGALATTNATG